MNVGKSYLGIRMRNAIVGGPLIRVSLLCATLDFEVVIFWVSHVQRSVDFDIDQSMGFFAPTILHHHQNFSN